MNCYNMIIHSVNVDLMDEELSVGFKTTSGVKNLEVRRIKVRDQATNSVILMFQRSILPSQVYFGYLTLNVKLYALRPLRCFKCQRCGHVRDKCRSKDHCPTCGGPHEVNICSQGMKCHNCGGNHSVEFKDCSVY